VEPGHSPCVHLKTHEQHQKSSFTFQKKTKQAFSWFPAERLSQRAPDETHFFNINRATTVKETSWKGFWRSHAPRGASFDNSTHGNVRLIE
jgi:hypothetical protein